MEENILALDMAIKLSVDVTRNSDFRLQEVDNL